MGIKKLGQDKFEIRVKYQGVEVRRILRGTKQQANQVLSDIKSEIEKSKAENQIWRGLTNYKGRPKTFDEIAALYLQTLPTTKPNTINTYGCLLEHHILPLIGNAAVTSLKATTLEQFRAALLSKESNSKRTKGTKLSVRTVNTILAVVQAVLNFAERAGEIERAPKLKALSEPATDIDPLSQDELAEVLRQLGSYWRPIIQLLASTGMREGEMLGLQWSDIDFSKEEIRITKQVTLGQEVAPKTASSVRTIRMLPGAKLALQELRKRALTGLNKRILVTPTGKALTRQEVYRQWRVALRDAGLRHRPLHQLRHTYASLLLEAGVKPGWVSRQLGHSTLKQTFDAYIRYIPSSDQYDHQLASKVFTDTDKNAPKNAKRSS